MSTLADDVARQSALLERIQLEIHLAHNRVFHVTAPSWEAALKALEAVASVGERTLAEPPEERIAPFAPPAAPSFGDQWEAL
jgi:hypothetical protein